MDIPKIISFVDPDKATEFKKKNAAAHLQQGHSDGCCSLQTQYYMKESEFGAVDRILNSILKSENYFKNSLKQILDQCEQAQSTMLARAKTQGYKMTDEKMEKEFLAKCMMETVNRFIFRSVYNELKT